MAVVYPLELFPEYVVTQLLFRDVKNAAELRKMAMAGDISGALINPTMVIDNFPILVAANKALHLQKVGQMKTRSLYSEIIFNLSPTNNISEAFKKFGISDTDKAVLIVLVHSKEDEQNMDEIRVKVDGQQIPAELLSTLSDIPKIKKLYKVTSQEERCGSVAEAIVCRMAIKHVL